MSKKPKIKHSYDRDSDKMKISIRGYSLSRTTRDEILEDLIRHVERGPIANPKKSGKNSDQKRRKVSTVERR